MVPKGCPLAHWVHDAIELARVIYLEHDKQESDGARYKSVWSQPLALRLSRSWPRIKNKFPADVVSYLSTLRPSAIVSQVLDFVPHDPGVERLALARSKEALPPGPIIRFLETGTQSHAPADDVSDAIWDDAVCWALDNPRSFGKALEASYRAWVNGDLEEIERISVSCTISRFAPIRYAAIGARNRSWLPTIRELVTLANEPTLILVGVAHLGGTDGLVAELKASGLKLSRADQK